MFLICHMSYFCKFLNRLKIFSLSICFTYAYAVHLFNLYIIMSDDDAAPLTPMQMVGTGLEFLLCFGGK